MLAQGDFIINRVDAIVAQTADVDALITLELCHSLAIKFTAVQLFGREMVKSQRHLTLAKGTHTVLNTLRFSGHR